MNLIIFEGHTIADTNVDYVVVGETRNYNYDLVNKAAELVRRGAKLIGANKDVRDRVRRIFFFFFPSLPSLLFWNLVGDNYGGQQDRRTGAQGCQIINWHQQMSI
jgi:hypothetical protein